MPLKKSFFDTAAKYNELAVNIAKSVNSQNTTWPIGGFILKELEVLFPAGHVNLTGFRLMYQGTAIVPWNQPTTFIVGENERRVYEVDITFNQNPIIVTQNRDTIQHTLFFVAKLEIIPLQSDTVTLPDLSTTPLVL